MNRTVKIKKKYKKEIYNLNNKIRKGMTNNSINKNKTIITKNKIKTKMIFSKTNNKMKVIAIKTYKIYKNWSFFKKNDNNCSIFHGFLGILYYN